MNDGTNRNNKITFYLVALQRHMNDDYKYKQPELVLSCCWWVTLLTLKKVDAMDRIAARHKINFASEGTARPNRSLDASYKATTYDLAIKLLHLPSEISMFLGWRE
jgi:hypothetical protein